MCTQTRPFSHLGPYPMTADPQFYCCAAGKNNIFRNNFCNLGSASGDCIAVYCDGPNDGCNNVVKCNNQVVSAGGTGKLTNLKACVQ